jgi:B-box zinc finger
VICPKCGFTSLEDLPTCPQCGSDIPLSGSCASCGSPLDADTYLYCRICGAINSSRSVEAGIVCDTHTDNRSTGFCVVCGKAVCDECMEIYGNRILCSDPRHRVYLDDWQVLHSFDFEYEAAMLYANLEQQDIESEVFSKLNPDTTDTPLRPTIVEVRVPKKKYHEAQEIAKSLGLSGDETEDKN